MSGINWDRLRRNMRPYLETAMDRAEDELLGSMRRNVHTRTYKNAPGKPEWRSEIDRGMKKMPVASVGDAIEGGISIDMTEGSPEFVRMKVIEKGAGSAVGNPPIHAGPLGRDVWDGDLSVQAPSWARAEFDLPPEFNQKGNEFVEKSVSEGEEALRWQVEKTIIEMPDSVFDGVFTN